MESEQLSPLLTLTTSSTTDPSTTLSATTPSSSSFRFNRLRVWTVVLCAVIVWQIVRSYHKQNDANRDVVFLQSVVNDESNGYRMATGIMATLIVIQFLVIIYVYCATNIKIAKNEELIHHTRDSVVGNMEAFDRIIQLNRVHIDCGLEKLRQELDHHRNKQAVKVTPVVSPDLEKTKRRFESWWAELYNQFQGALGEIWYYNGNGLINTSGNKISSSAANCNIGPRPNVLKTNNGVFNLATKQGRDQWRQTVQTREFNFNGNNNAASKPASVGHRVGPFSGQNIGTNCHIGPNKTLGSSLAAATSANATPAKLPFNGNNGISVKSDQDNTTSNQQCIGVKANLLSQSTTIPKTEQGLPENKTDFADNKNNNNNNNNGEVKNGFSRRQASEISCTDLAIGQRAENADSSENPLNSSGSSAKPSQVSSSHLGDSDLSCCEDYAFIDNCGQENISDRNEGELRTFTPLTVEELRAKIEEGERKQYRRLFIPGRGWVSAKRLQEEAQMMTVDG